MDNLIKSIYVDDLDLVDVKTLTNNKCPIVLYDNLDINDDILEVIGKNNRCFLLFPTVHGSNSGHWLALLYNDKTNTLEHFDPYGLDVNQEMTYSSSRHVQANILGKLYAKAQQKGIKIIFNNVRYQKLTNGVNTCGRHCAIRLRFHYLTPTQYENLMSKQSMSPDWLVSILTFLELFSNDNQEEITVKSYLQIR